MVKFSISKDFQKKLIHLGDKKIFSLRSVLKFCSGYVALTLAYLIWGANIVIAKLTLLEIPVMTLAFLRFSLAVILLLPFILPMGKNHFKIKSKDLIRLTIAGILLITLNITFFYEGLQRTTATNASVIILIVPILAVIVGWIFLKEKIYAVNLFGIVTGLIGALTIIGFPLIFIGNLDSNVFFGNILLITGAAISVLGLLLTKKSLSTYTPLTLTFFLFLIGAITFIIPAFLEYLKNPTWINNLTIVGILGLTFITVLSTICAFYLLNVGLKTVDTFKVSLFQYMQPAVAATLAVPLLGERLSFSFIIGTCLIVLGVYWGTLGKVEHHYLHHTHHRT